MKDTEQDRKEYDRVVHGNAFLEQRVLYVLPSEFIPFAKLARCTSSRKGVSPQVPSILEIVRVLEFESLSSNFIY